MPLELKPSQFSHYRDFVGAYIAHKRATRSWSYGVWAKQLGLRSSSLLVMIANGQRHPGPKLVRKLLAHWQLPHDEAQHFADLVRIEKASRDIGRYLELVGEISPRLPAKSVLKLALEDFEALADWRHYAVREMVQLADFKEDTGWFVRRLRGSHARRGLRAVLYRLIDKGLIRRNRNGILQHASGTVRTTDDVASAALKEYHRDVLELARSAVLEVGVEQREISGGCFPIKRTDLPQIKAAIRKFQHELCETYGVETDGDDIYQLEVAFFPLTEKTARPEQQKKARPAPSARQSRR